MLLPSKIILFVSSLPPPAGGISTWTSQIFKYGFDGIFTPIIVNTSHKGGRKNFEKAKFSMSELKRNCNILRNLFKKIFLHKPSIVHLNCNLSQEGVFRIGGIVQNKGISELLLIAAKNLNADFIFIGSVTKDVKNIIKGASDNVLFTGMLNHEKVMEKLCLGDIFIFPSHYEDFGISVLEAMSVGLPIIATKVGAIPEMVDEKNGGFLVDPRDVNKMNDYLRILISDSELRKKMGEYNREKAQKFYKYSTVNKKIIKIYQSILHPNPPNAINTLFF